MNEQLGEAVLKLALDGSGFKVGANGVTGSLNDIIKKTGQAALGFTGGLGLYNAIEKVRMSLINNVNDFRAYEKSLKEVSTLVDTTVVDMGNLEAGIDKVSKKWARGKDSLTSALYETISANVAAGDSIAFLDKAVEASVAGVTDSKVAVDGLTSVMNAYGLTINEITDVSDAFFVGVRDGKTRFEELAAGIGKVVPIASQVEMSYSDLIAVTASLTMSGLRTEEAFTGVRTILTAILKPSEDAKETAKLLGIEFDVNALKAKGFAKFMQEIKEATGGSQTALAKLFPDVQGLNAAMSVTSEQGGKNLNKVLGDMEKRMGETQVAAEKMKDSFDFDAARFGNNFKNLGIGIADGLSPAIRAIMNTTSGWFDFIGRIANQDASLLSKFTTDRSSMSTEDLEEFARRNKLIIEDIKKMNSGQDQIGLIDEGKIKRAENFIKVAQEEIDMRKAESAEAKRALSFQQYAQGEKDKADKKEAEAARERAAKKQKETEDLLRNQEQQKKNQEIAQKNADLLNKLESDRLAISERIAGIESGRNLQSIEDKKRAVEAIAKYNKITYDAQKEDLQKIVDDENVSTEERIEANNKLFTVKNEAAKSAYESEKQALELSTESDIAEQKKRIEAIQNYIKELDVQYKESADRIKNSDLSKADKSTELSRLEKEQADRKKALQFMIDNSDQAFNQIELRGELAAKNIDAELQSTLGGTFTTKVQTEVDLKLKDLFDDESDSIFNGLLTQYNELKKALASDDFGAGTKREIERELKKVQTAIAVEVSSVARRSIQTSLDILTSEVGIKAEDMAVEIGDIISSVGDSTKNGYIKAAGEVVSFFGKIAGAINDKYEKEYRASMKQIELAEKLNEGTEKTINKTREWLIQIGEIDTSNMSLSELKAQQKSILTKGAGDLNSILGIDQYSSGALTNEDIKILVDIYNSNKDAIGLVKNLRSSQGSMIGSEQAGNLKTLAAGKTYDEFIAALSSEQESMLKEFGRDNWYDLFVKKYGLDTSDFYSKGENDLINKTNFQQFQSLSSDQIATLFKVANNANTNGLDIGSYTSSITDIAKQYSEPLKTTQGYISNYGMQSGIDPTQSKTKDDLLEDLQTLLDLGSISELEYYKTLYEYATGIRKTGVGNSYEWFSESDRKLYRKKYEDILNGGTSGIIGLADGGIAMSPTYAQIAEAGVPEAVIPLDKLGSVMSSMYGGLGMGTINVNLNVDPNIPITRDSASALSEAFGQRIETVFRSRGI